MDKKLHKLLSDRQQKGTLRSLSSFEGRTDFFSNDYLGFAAQSIEAATSGSTGSRLLSGNSVHYEALESQIAAFFDAPACLHFNSGYDANLGIFSSIPQKGDLILYDEYIHASVRDGVRLSWARSFSFRHNDLEHLEQRLKAAEGMTVYVAVEALYSMDGDFAPLSELVSLTEKYGAYLIVDEAHSGGVYGEEGRGRVHELGLQDQVFLRLMTFGKAYGSHGACILCEEGLKSFLINYCRPFIYSTALPEFVVAHNLERLTAETGKSRRAQLQQNIQLFRELYAGVSPSAPDSPIQIVSYNDVQATRDAAQRIQENGYAVKPIYAPTVPEGKERLRICIHTFNTEEDIRGLVAALRGAQ